jgi:hypothetical protein
MLWVDAIKQVRSDKLTNRDASGLIEFARAVYNKVTKTAGPNVALTPFDWYAYALPALGWFKSGDKFLMDTTHQLAQYPAALQLWTALLTLAGELDGQGVKFSIPSGANPRGTLATYKQLATDAWDVMKKEAPSPKDVAKAQPVDEPIKVADTDGNKTDTTAETIPPKKSTSSGGDGALIFLALLVLGSKRKRSR